MSKKQNLPPKPPKPLYPQKNWFQGLDGANIPDDVLEFGLAMDRYKTAKRRPFPTFGEVLDVLKSLGYRKVEKPET